MKIIVYGSQGTMGQLATQYFKTLKNEVIEVDAQSSDDHTLKDINDVLDTDLIVDFSHVSQLDTLLDYAIKKQKPLLIATTGYSQEQEARILEASKKIPIFKSANLSLGIHLMRMILKDYTKILEQYYDIEIIEKHHKHKVDAPSGTAHLLFETINHASKIDRELISDRPMKRKKKAVKDIGVSSIRAGQIVGEHTVLFASDDDLIELKHTAQSKMMFVKGAWIAATFIVTQKNGYYTMDDLSHERMKEDVNS